MPRAKNMNVDVVVSKAKNAKGVSFALKTGKKRAAHRVRFENDRHPGVMVYFNIKDPNRTGLEFKQEPSQALWVNSQGTECPTNACHWDQFVPLSVEKNIAGKYKQLIVYCRNEQIKEFAFTLWFLKPDGTAVDYDPIGDGNNGLRL